MKLARDSTASAEARLRAFHTQRASGAKSVNELNTLMSRLKWSYLTAKPGLSPVFSRLERATSVPKRNPSLFSPSPDRPKSKASPSTAHSRKATGGSLDTRTRGPLNFLNDAGPDSPLLPLKNEDFMPGILSDQGRRLALIDCESDIHKEIERLQYHIRSNSTASRREKSLTLRQGIRPVTPYMEFEGVQMPTDLVILTQTRRRVIAEIRKQSIPGLVMSKLNEMKTVLMPENMKNVEVASNR